MAIKETNGHAPLGERVGSRWLASRQHAANDLSASIGWHPSRKGSPNKLAFEPRDDPIEGRMNEFAAHDGLTLDELKWCFTQIASSPPIRAASVTAYDPAIDVSGRATVSGVSAVLPSSLRLRPLYVIYSDARLLPR